MWRPALRLAAAARLLGPLSVPTARLVAVAVAVGGRRRRRALVALLPAGLLAALPDSLDAAALEEATGRDVGADCLRGVGSNTGACVLQAVRSECLLLGATEVAATAVCVCT